MRLATTIIFIVVLLIIILFVLQYFTDLDFPSFSPSRRSSFSNENSTENKNKNDNYQNDDDNKPLKIAVITFTFIDGRRKSSSSQGGKQPTIHNLPNKNKAAFYHSLAWINKRSYCKKWGYDHILANETEIMEKVAESYNKGSWVRRDIMRVNAGVWGKL